MSDPAQQAAFNSWSLPWGVTIACAAGALVYVRGWLLLRRTRRAQFTAERLACFLGGLTILWLALASPLDALDDISLAAHMTQHLCLMSVVPPLLLLGAPLVPLLRGLPRPIIRRVIGPLIRTRVFHHLGRVLTRPAFAWIAMNAAYVSWHLPAAFELALRSERWHDVEHACFFGTSLLFWYVVIEPWPMVGRPLAQRWSRWLVLPFLLSADLVNTAVCACLTFAGHVVYPSYASAPGLFGLSALNDQVAAGALMWVAGSIIFLIPAGLLTFRLLSQRRPASAPHSPPLIIPTEAQ